MHPRGYTGVNSTDGLSSSGKYVNGTSTTSSRSRTGRDGPEIVVCSEGDEIDEGTSSSDEQSSQGHSSHDITPTHSYKQNVQQNQQMSHTNHGDSSETSSLSPRSTSTPPTPASLEKGDSCSTRQNPVLEPTFYDQRQSDDTDQPHDEGVARMHWPIPPQYLPDSRYQIHNEPNGKRNESNSGSEFVQLTSHTARPGSIRYASPYSKMPGSSKGVISGGSIYGRSNSLRDVRPNRSQPNAQIYTPTPVPLQAHTDLSNWAPANQIPDPSTLPHLPDWHAPDSVIAFEYSARNTSISRQLSSLPNGLIQKDIDYTMRMLLNEKVFADLVMDPLGRHRFREFLEAEGETAELDMWFDAYRYSRQIEELRVNGQAFHDIYLTENAAQVQLPLEIQREVLSSLRRHLIVDTSFDSTQMHLLHKMYHNQFQRFVKHKIIQETHVKLGKFNLSEQDQEGLGDCFCLTNPRLPDHPIVLVSDGFVGVSGYPKSQIVGRNCRFLQGPGTAPESVQRIRDGLNSGAGCTELLLNYRRNGEPFYCLVCIIPLHDSTGSIAYFIGGQTNVTGLLANEKNLGFLIGGEDSLPPKADMTSSLHPMQVSPTMALYKQEMGIVSTSNLTVGTTHSQRVRGPAAGGALPQMTPSSPTRAEIPGSGPTKATIGTSWSFKNLFSRSPATGTGIVGIQGRQVLAGAESTLNGNALPLQDQLALFQDTYTKLIIFKQHKREVTFVTRQMLIYFGLPCSTAPELYSSRLIHSDITSFLTGNDKAETKRLHANLKNAVKRGESFSVMCGVKFLGKNNIFGRNDHLAQKFGMMHLTPLKDRDGRSIAFVAVFA